MRTIDDEVVFYSKQFAKDTTSRRESANLSPTLIL